MNKELTDALHDCCLIQGLAEALCLLLNEVIIGASAQENALFALAETIAERTDALGRDLDLLEVQMRTPAAV